MKHFKPLLLVFTLFFITNMSSIFAQPIVCYADLKFSLQPGKSIQMYPSDFLSLPNIDDKLYKLEIKDQGNNEIVGNIINYNTQTKTYVARVTNIMTQNACWVDFSVLPSNSTHPIANCKANLITSVAPKNVTLIPLTVNQLSINYVSLFLNKSIFDCDDLGKNTVKLSAVGADNVISQCECIVDIQDKLAPIVEMKSNVSIVLNSLVPYVLTADEVGTYSDNCDINSVQIVPNQITCSSPNPTTVTLIVKDKTGNTVSASTQVNYAVTNINNAIVCNDQIEIKVAPTSVVTITPIMVLEGNYSCNTNFEVKLSHNGVNYPKPELTWNDAGKTISYIVTDKNTNNSCWGNIIVTKPEGCNTPFVVCDTKCPEVMTGDCSSGYTDTDNLDWPCGFDIYLCDVISSNQLSPEELETIHNIPSENVKPQIINFDCSVIFMSYSDQVVSFGSLSSQNKKILRTWSVLNWLDGNLYEYTQIFKVYINGLEICDTLPWNTPFGDCASGHTDFDAIEWPADITVQNAQISLSGLRSNPNVHPNDVEPTLVENCTGAYEIAYFDVVNNIDVDTKLIQRTWNVFNWFSTVNSTYVQNITLNYDNVNQVCAFTYYGEPLDDVNMGLGVTDESGCTTFNFVGNYEIHPSKSGNAKDDVDIMDLVMVYEGVLNIRELNPYQMIAADINGVNGVTTLDMVTIKKMIDGEIDNWPINTPVWKFIDKNHQIVNGLVTPYRDFINTNNLIYSNEFIGIKMGDVNGSYSADMDSNKPVFTVIKADDIALNKGETYETSFSSDRNQNLVAVKLDFKIKDKGISIKDIHSDVLPGFDQIKNVIITEDNISISWAINLDVTPQGVSLRNNEDFLEITYISNKNSIISDVLDLNQEVTNQIKQSGDVDPADVNLFWDLKIVNGIFDAAVSRLNVTPNPFLNGINVLGLNDVAQFEVFNSAGISIRAGILNVDGQIELSNLENGFYFLRVLEKGKKPSIHKLIKVE